MKDSNLRSPKAFDLQSNPVVHLGNFALFNFEMGPTGFEPVMDVTRRVKSPLRSATTLTIPCFKHITYVLFFNLILR